MLKIVFLRIMNGICGFCFGSSVFCVANRNLFDLAINVKITALVSKHPLFRYDHPYPGKKWVCSDLSWQFYHFRSRTGLATCLRNFLERRNFLSYYTSINLRVRPKRTPLSQSLTFCSNFTVSARKKSNLDFWVFWGVAAKSDQFRAQLATFRRRTWQTTLSKKKLGDRAGVYFRESQTTGVTTQLFPMYSNRPRSMPTQTSLPVSVKQTSKRPRG